MTEKENRLLARVKAYFGNEVEWCDDTKLVSARGTMLKPDLVGKDSNGLHVIVEIKNNPSATAKDHATNKRDGERESIGQILDYATAYMEQNDVSIKDLRLFIIGDYFSETVDKICQFLRDQGINIEHKYI